MIRKTALSASWRTAGNAVAAAALALLLGPAGVQAQDFCVGNCDGVTEPQEEVTVDEIINMVNLALTGGTEGCANGDANGDGQITVEEIIEAVNNALEGCMDDPPPGACGDGETGAGEQCDNGGVCAGESAGTACTSQDDCAGDVGICVGGPENLRACLVSNPGACASLGGECVKCRPIGGDGCAANCTNEVEIAFPFKAGTIQQGGVAIEDGSGATVYGAIFNVPLAFDTRGSIVMTAGAGTPDGAPIPVVIKAADVDLPEIPVQTIACACVRGAEYSTCGGFLFDENGAIAVNCTAGFPGQETCPANRPCAPVHGPGNTASGFVGCSASAEEVSVEVVQDCGEAGVDPTDPFSTITTTGTGAGSAFLIQNAAIGTVVGLCSGTAPDYGADGMFCTDDDPLANRGTPNSLALSTGEACGQIQNAADFPGDTVPPDFAFACVNGQRFSCDGANLNSAAGANLAGVFTSCDQPTVSDIVVVTNFESPE